jgi:glycogen phosphorylase
MTVAYFSMEVGLDDAIPTYSGGLGVLAGDTVRAAADLGVPLVAVTLLYRQGYFRQHLDDEGQQTETPAYWAPERHLEPLRERIKIEIEGRDVVVAPWRYVVRGITGGEVPVLLLDASLDENDERDRALTGQLYGGDERYRLCQEALLGIGGTGMLRQLGYHDIETFHMNEGHSALLALALLEERVGVSNLHSASQDDIEAVRARCVFTTHTPVPAGHDRFSIDLVREVLGPDRADALASWPVTHDGTLNMTYLSLYAARYVNGVSSKHADVSRVMYPGQRVEAITNGVHAVTWVVPPFAELFDRDLPGWRVDNNFLRNAVRLDREDILKAHEHAKGVLLREMERRTGDHLNAAAFTIGFARRVTTYKRAGLLFTDPERLRAIASKYGRIQILYAGKAHPHDQGAKALIRSVYEAKRELENDLQIVYLEDYDVALARLLCGGVDLWLNNPQKPLEASGTSGMKAALNGIPSLSVLDGWWIEGHFEGATGWSIGDDDSDEDESHREAHSLYHKLEDVVLPLFYEHRLDYASVMRGAIAINGAYFNASRMMLQYLQNAYSRPREDGAGSRPRLSIRVGR